jgi:hypothetical protein
MGLDLTAATLAAGLKYPVSFARVDDKCQVKKKGGYFSSERSVVAWIREQQTVVVVLEIRPGIIKLGTVRTGNRLAVVLLRSAIQVLRRPTGTRPTDVRPNIQRKSRLSHGAFY